MGRPYPVRLPRLGPLPREHGTWAMLVVPWAVGCGIGGRLTIRGSLLLVGGLALFLAQHRLAAWYRHRHRSMERRERRDTLAALAVLTAIGLGAMAAALIDLPPATLTVLVGAGGLSTAASLLLVDARLDHALPGQMLAAIGLGVMAPGAYFATGGTRAREALALWVLDGAFFLWAVFYVRLKIEARARRLRTAPGERLALVATPIGVDVVLAVVAVVGLRLGDLSPLGIIAFVPAAVQSITGTARLDRVASLKRVGILMLAHSVAFGVLLIVFT